MKLTKILFSLIAVVSVGTAVYAESHKAAMSPSPSASPTPAPKK